MNKEILETYINTHKNHFKGRYKFLCGYHTSDTHFKCIYYIIDNYYRMTHIYLDVDYKDEVTYTISEPLNNEEQNHIVVDLLKHIISYDKYPRVLNYSYYEDYASGKRTFINGAPIDYVGIYEYMKYHKGINSKTVDQFYEIFLPHMNTLLEQAQYTTYIQTLEVLLEDILRENEWVTQRANYLDTEYQYHLYYIREIIRTVYRHLNDFYEYAYNPLKECIKYLCMHTRFTFAIMSDFMPIVLSQLKIMNRLFVDLQEELVLYDKNNDNNPEVNLVFSYLYYTYKGYYEEYKCVVKNIVRDILNNMLTYANHDLDLALGNTILRTEGYELLIEIFQEDYNTYIFTCFPISSFPDDLHDTLRKELEKAVIFFAGRMENNKYEQSSLEQISNINRLLLENYKEYYK